MMWFVAGVVVGSVGTGFAVGVVAAGAIGDARRERDDALTALRDSETKRLWAERNEAHWLEKAKAGHPSMHVPAWVRQAAADIDAIPTTEEQP